MFGKAASPERVQRMVAALRRRGPDDAGVWEEATRPVVLGHARLSIIDLSSAGHQPMSLPDGSLTIVFNGEIYNYRELRRELEAGGAKFVSHSDTEVLLWGWKLWGQATPSRLRGMFAFAMWDRASATLTLVRDRMGIKPLLWSRGSGGWVFGSSLTSLFASEQVPCVMNEQGFFDLFSLGSVFQPGTIIRDVYSLAPGTMMVVRESGACQAHEYWRLERDAAQVQALGRMPYEEHVRLTRQMLEEACRYHLIADVPVGSFLSGGVDSTTITALMARHARHPIKSFSIGFENGADIQNELGDAKVAAHHIGCDHTEVVLTGADVAGAFDDFIDVIDQPSADGLNTYWVSKVARQQVKVTLSGLGGDELFAGYDFFGWFDAAAAGQKPTLLDRALACGYALYPHTRWTLRGYLKTASPLERLAIVRRLLSDRALQGALAPELGRAFEAGHVQRYIAGLGIGDPDLIAQTTRYECKNYLLNTLLRDADALSMGYGLEVRPILLDHPLVEYALALPAASKRRCGIAKAVLKDAAKDLLPGDFFCRRKTGFTLPIERWLDGDLRERFVDTLRDRAAERFFSRRYLDQLVGRGAQARGNRAAWLTFVFLAWARKRQLKPTCGS